MAKNTKSRVLIFGASGNLGSRLALKFQKDFEVGLAARTTSKLKQQKHPHIYKVELKNKDQIENAIDSFRPDIIINAS